MGRHKNRTRTQLQGDLQQIPAVQSQDRPPVRVDVANGLQLPRQNFSLLKPWQKNHIVYLSHLPVLLINRTDLTGDHKPGLISFLCGAVLYSELFLQNIKPLLCRDKLLCQLLTPLGMSKIPAAQKADPLSPGPQVQILRRTIPAGCPGIPGMNMKVRYYHSITCLL